VTPAFGGERAAFGESPDGEASVPQGVGACQRVPALPSDPILDDFEQDSIFIRSTPERYGVWYLSNDGSPDGKQTPETYGVERGGHAGSNHALHYRVESYTEWGAVAGFQIRYKSSDGIRCPFNAEAFGGLAFVARGTGRIRVQLNTPDVVPADQEGRCKDGCWDAHGSLVYLTDDWTEHRIPWSSFQQRGWGTSVRLNLAELMAVNFFIGREDQPTELWLDDVRFVSAEEAAAAPPPAVPAPSSTPEPEPGDAPATSDARQPSAS
jgi:hypothetical protein